MVPFHDLERDRMADGRPNIVFIMTDQQRFDAMGCVNPLVKTPNIDALAKNGIRFSQAVS
ncbi:MAG: sulfatase-like hydrolase/transferase, partial [Clostridia bacterium]|nr:sulfatase-like hydrolase/transferase [Clostridia bacterium]